MKTVTHQLNLFRLSLSGAILFYCVCEIVLAHFGLEAKYGRWNSVAAVVGQMITYAYLLKFVPKAQVVAIENR